MAAYELFFLGGRRRKAVTPNMGSHDQGLEPLCTSPEAISSDTAGFCDLDLSLDDFKSSAMARSAYAAQACTMGADSDLK